MDNNDLRNFYVKQKLHLHSDWNTLKEYSDKIKWLTIQEIWNDSPSDDLPFRVTLNIQKTGTLLMVRSVGFLLIFQEELFLQKLFLIIWKYFLYIYKIYQSLNLQHPLLLFL